MAETLTDILPARPKIPPHERPPADHHDHHALEDLAGRAQERQPQPPMREHEQAAHDRAPSHPAAQLGAATKETEATASALAQETSETAPKRAWWKNLISKPVPMPRRIVETMIDDYHKAFPYVFGDHAVRPDITYEHSLYYPPFAVLDVKVPDESFSKRYPLFNEFVTQEVSELAADKRPFFGPLLGLAARVMGGTSYRLMYARSFARWRNVERTLDRTYGKNERKRLIHRAYFLEGDELKNLEEKAREAGCPLDEAYRPTRETKGSIADDSFWQKIPGRWKDVVVRFATAAAAHVGKVTDVSLLTLIALVDLSALYTGLTILSRNLPFLSTVVATSFPAYLGINLALMGISSVGIMYHELAHQMTKTLLDLNNRKN